MSESSTVFGEGNGLAVTRTHVDGQQTHRLCSLRRPLAREYFTHALQEPRHVICLKNISPKENARGAGLNYVAHDANHFVVRTSTAAAENQDRYGAGRHNRAHAFYIPSAFGLNHVGP